MIFFHGNAGNVGFRLPFFKNLHSKLKVNLFGVSYRGYGWSKGEPTEAGLYMDAEGALDFLLKSGRVDRNKIIVYGQSVGGAVAIDLAFRRQSDIKLVITENTFTSLREIALYLFPILKLFPLVLNFVQRLKMDSLEKIKQLKTPVLLIYGTRDTTVPPEQSIQLHQSSPSKAKMIWMVEGANHNDLPMQAGAAFYEKVRNFIEENLSKTSGDRVTVDAEESCSIAANTNVLGRSST
eukprot:Selendium_serpulae@DN6192_c0_g1_i2.p1